MVIKIQPKSELFKVPVKAHDSDFCYDVWAVSEEQVAPNVWKYGLGFAVQMVRDKEWPSYISLSIDFRPRSSVWKTGMTLSNCTGTIDEGYRGEISAVFYHVMPNMPRYKVGDRIGQIKIGGTFPMEFKVVDELDDTDRGSGAYGSSGLK